MDAFDFDSLKVEKANAMLKFHRLRNITKLFRLFELCLVLFLLSWTSSRLPFAVRISGDYFRQLIAIIVSPAFIFVLSNVIVITLVAKSGQFTKQSKIVNNVETDLYEEFIKNVANRLNFETEIAPPVPESEKIVYHDKQIICESEFTTVDTAIPKSKTFRRSQSENLKREKVEKKPCEKLRRSETEKFGRDVNSGEATATLVEKLSSEEFQRTVEAFIAKQTRFHKEEKICIVPYTQS